MKTPKSKSVNYLDGFWLKLVSDIIKSAPHGLSKITALKERFSFKLRWEHVVIAFLLALLLGGARARVIPEPIKLPPTHKLMKTLPLPAVEPAQATLDLIPVPEPTPPPQPAYTAPVSSGAVDCGSDPMMAYIYTVESGCRSWAINPGGCIGLGQACPGGKLPCGLYDWACQDAWFRNYAVAAYGSIYNAYIYRQSHNYW